MTHQPPGGPGRSEPGAAADHRTRPVRVLPPAAPRPTRLIGNFVVPPPEAPSTPEEVPPTTEVSAVGGPSTTLMPALPPVAGGPTKAPAPPPAPAAPPAEPPVVADQPTDDLPAGSGRPADAATVAWLAGPGPGPRPFPRVVPRRHPVRALLLVVLALLAVAALVWAVVLS